MDLTSPRARMPGLRTSPSELLVVAVPVYVGRVPGLLHEWLCAVQADGTPAVCVVVYGNRDFEDALLELRDTVQACGGVPIACAAFVGEHSFSSSETPIAVARPDAADLQQARSFGRRVEQTLRSISSVDRVGEIRVPGRYPYRELEDPLSVDFIDIDDGCLQCGVCAESCPVGAIAFEDSSLRDKEKCVLCCACIKHCPEGARTMRAGTVKDIAVRVSQGCQERRDPVFFF